MPQDTTQQRYNAPPGTPSSIGPQIRTDFYNKKALKEARKEQYFSQLADVTNMPKHMGKTIKMYHYLPLLDDANVNDQGIDAAGAQADGTVGLYKATVKAAPNATSFSIAAADEGLDAKWFTGEALAAADAITAAEAAADAYFATIGLTDTTGALAAGWQVTGAGGNQPAITPVPNTGNLYGSSKDVGSISAKLPALSETGGRVNRVGFKRISLEGTIEKFGFFYEYTQESLDFDTDAELMMHITRENVNGASEITEDALQIDLLNGAGIIRYAGDATSTDTLTGDAGSETLLTFEELMRLEIDLDNNRCPKNTKVITGTRMIDTYTIDAARYMYVGTEVINMLKTMTDTFGDKAFIDIRHYGAATQLAVGEIGSMGGFRIIVVPEMMSWEGAGAAIVGTNAGYRETGGSYDVFPMLVIGSESFTTIGFQTDGKTVKFKIYNKPPGEGVADRDDPYGETGFSSIKWYYGTMIQRPERIALVKTIAPW